MGGACSTFGGEENCIQGFGGETRVRDHFEDPGENGMIILRWIYTKWHGGGAWSGLIWLRVGRDGGHL